MNTGTMIQLVTPEETEECTFPRDMVLQAENLEMDGDVVKAVFIKLPSGRLHRIPSLPFTFNIVQRQP